VRPNVSLGALYILPLILLATVASRWQITAYALLFSLLRELLSPYSMQEGYAERMLLVSFVFLMTGLLGVEVSENYRLLARHWREVEGTEARLRALMEAGPLGIVTADGTGRVLESNAAARRMLGVGEGQWGKITEHFPALEAPLKNAASLVGRQNHMECTGVRRGGEKFMASVWFAVYEGPDGAEMAASVWDASEDLRDREWASQEFVLDTSRLLVRAMAHEMRNLTGAAAQIHNGLAARAELRDDPHFRALGTLVETMERLSPAALRAGGGAGVTDVAGALEELRIILEPMLEEGGVEARWEVEPGLPAVRAERAALLQIFLNLAKNALRAMEGSEAKVLRVQAAEEGGRVAVRFHDSGHGVRDAGVLFQPFHRAAEGTGLGLYVSRTLARAAGGELRHEPQAGEGACFVVELPAAGGRVK
jgi:signal transduction histidine kinase